MNGRCAEHTGDASTVVFVALLWFLAIAVAQAVAVFVLIWRRVR